MRGGVRAGVLERRRGDAIFLGEANVSQDGRQRYFAVDGGDGVQLLFDFRTCAAQWLAHARGRAAPLIDALNNRPRHPEQQHRLYGRGIRRWLAPCSATTSSGSGSPLP